MRLFQDVASVNQPRSVVLVDSHEDRTSSKVLLLLALLCGYLHEDSLLPVDALTVLEGDEDDGHQGSVQTVQVRMVTWSPDKCSGFGGIRGLELGERVTDRLQTFLSVLGWERFPQVGCYTIA